MVVPAAALRDEGTSYHYMPPSRHIDTAPHVHDRARAALDDHGIPHLTGMTWTTGAPFRETPDKIAARRTEGCLTVEMEAGALLAVARYRGIALAYYLYAGDDVSGPRWDHREWTTTSRRARLLEVAFHAVELLNSS